MLKTYHRRRREYPPLFARPENAHLTVIRLTNRDQATAWINSLKPTDNAQTDGNLNLPATHPR